MRGEILKRFVIYGLLFVVTTVGLFACGVGSTQTYSSVPVPMTTYLDNSLKKFAVYTSAGGGRQTLTEIDTGSDYYVIESSYVGSNILRTSQVINLYYDHGDVERSGVLAYSYVTYLNESGESIISTNNQVPIVIVPDGDISNDPSQNHAIMGMRINGNLSARLFLPNPYNQMFIFAAPESQLIFGNFSNEQLNNYGMITVPPISCDNLGAATTSNFPCWNDMAIPVKYSTMYNGNQTEATLNTLFDSGATSNMQFVPLPAWLQLSQTNQVMNQITGTLSTSSGNMNIPFNQPIAAEESAYNGGLVNAGNNLFNFYNVLFDQTNGHIGLYNVTANNSITVPLTYMLNGIPMGLHMPVSIGNNNVYAGVDTGSVGLRVLESSLSDMTGIQINQSITLTYGYADGVIINGYLASANINIGGVSNNMDFMIINDITCSNDKPDCPKSAFSASGRAGVMGVSLIGNCNESCIWNPLTQLPGNYSNGQIHH